MISTLQRHEKAENDHQRDNGADKDDLVQRIVTAQRFDQHIGGGEGGARDQNAQNAAKAGLREYSVQHVRHERRNWWGKKGLIQSPSLSFRPLPTLVP